jgi:hypothetical protein
LGENSQEELAREVSVKEGTGAGRSFCFAAICIFEPDEYNLRQVLRRSVGQIQRRCEMQQTQRPTGITILAVLAAIGGVFGLLAAITALGFAGVAAGALGGTVGLAAGSLLVIGGIILLVASVINLAFAYGAWNLKPWAWVLGLIGQGLGLLSAVITTLDSGSVSGQILNIVISALIIYYLLTPDVKRAFGRA